jgi:hypothetical protein
MRVDLDTAASIGEVDKATIRQWVHRGHIGRYDDGDPNGPYETYEILHWVQQVKSRDEAGRFAPAAPTASRLPNRAPNGTLGPASRRIVA